MSDECFIALWHSVCFSFLFCLDEVKEFLLICKERELQVFFLKFTEISTYMALHGPWKVLLYLSMACQMVFGFVI